MQYNINTNDPVFLQKWHKFEDEEGEWPQIEQIKASIRMYGDIKNHIVKDRTKNIKNLSFMICKLYSKYYKLYMICEKELNNYYITIKDIRPTKDIPNGVEIIQYPCFDEH